MMALVRSSWSRTTSSSPCVTSSSCRRVRTSASISDSERAGGSLSALAPRTQPPRPLRTSAPSRMNVPCMNKCCDRVFIVVLWGRRAQSHVWNQASTNRQSSPSGAAPGAPASASLLDQAHHHHFRSPIGGLHHVVHGEAPHRYCRQRFHLDSGPACHCRGRPQADSRQRFVQLGADLQVIQCDRVAQRDQLRRPLRRHHPRQLRRGEDVPFLHGLSRHEAICLDRHPHGSLGNRSPLRFGLLADVHHPYASGFVHVGQRHGPPPACSARSSASTAASSWGFTFPRASIRVSRTRDIASTTRPVSPPAAASSRNRPSSASSISVKAPRASYGAWASARLYRSNGPSRVAD